MTVEITRSQAIAIMSGLNRKHADSWRRNQMQTALESLHETVSDSDVLDDDDLNNLLDELIAAGSTGESIVIVPEERLVAREKEEEEEEEEEDEIEDPEDAEDVDEQNDPDEDDEEENDDEDEDEEEEEDEPEDDGDDNEEEEDVVVVAPEPRKRGRPKKDPDKPAPVQKEKKEKETAEIHTTRRPYRKKSGLQNVRLTKGRPYLAGLILARHGLEKGVTDEMIDDLNKRCTPRNRAESLSRLKLAWHVLSGYMEGTNK